MSKSYREPIELKLVDKEPKAFIWRGRNYKIEEVLKHWIISGDWWQQKSRRLHAVVEARHYNQRGQYELVYLTEARRWFLHRIYD